MIRRPASICVLLVLAYCGCSDSPETLDRQFFRTSRDERVYNPMTGRFEWSPQSTTSRPHRSASTGSTAREAEHSPGPTPGSNDDRVYNPQTRQFEPVR